MDSSISHDLLTYRETFQIFETDTDAQLAMTPGALLRMCQQCSSNHCRQLGLDYDFYKATQTVFLVAKVGLEWQRIPHAHEHITLQTSSEAMKHGLCKRIFKVFDSRSNHIGLVDYRTILVDIKSHKLLRQIPESYSNIPFTDSIDDCLTLTVPRNVETEYVHETAATYSQCDFNGHLNNTHYADVICDGLPLEEITQKPVKRMIINFRREIERGDSFTVSRKLLEDGTWYVEGTQSQKEHQSTQEAVKPVKNFDSLIELAD